jgi:hypothetical protein
LDIPQLQLHIAHLSPHLPFRRPPSKLLEDVDRMALQLNKVLGGLTTQTLFKWNSYL